MIKKYFTPQEANKRLPLVKQIVGDILAKARQLKSAMAGANASSQKGAHEKILAEMNRLVDELESLGCFYKDWNFEKGLVDFPAIIDGQEVLLCWHSDEPDVRWYHGFEDGFAGRRAIPEHLLNDATQEVRQDSGQTT
jgi:hypothetical protein